MADSNLTKLCMITLVAGCAGSPAQVLNMNPEKLQDIDIAPLCNAYAFSGQKNEKLEAEIKRRDVILAEDPSYNPDRLPFTDREWEAIRDKKIFIGMSEAALFCSWGAPSACGDINTSTGIWGTHRQIVYQGCGSYSANYVYTENGYVTSWQQ